MKRAGYYLLTACVSFTVLVLFYSCMSLAGLLLMPDALVMLQFFAVVCAISLLLFFVDRFFSGRLTFPWMLAQIACAIVPVFGLGGLVFGWFPFSLQAVAMVGGIVLLVYFAVAGINTLLSRLDARDINAAIRKKKNKKDGKKETGDATEHD